MAENIWSLLGMLAAVAAILALAYGCTRLLGAWGTAGFGRMREPGELGVLRQVSIGRGQRLMLIRLGKRCLLLGVTNEAISILAELTEEEAEVWFAKELQTAQNAGFIDALRDSMTKKKREEHRPDEWTD